MSRLDDRYQREEDRFADHPGWTSFRWGVAIALVIAGIVLVVSVLGFAIGWFNTGKDIVGPANVKAQNFQVRQSWNELVTGADNACQASATNTGQQGDPTFLEDPALAYAASYRRTWAEYNRRMDNAFEAKVIRRLGLTAYPRHVPDFREAHGKHPDWCKVSENLADIGPA